MGWLSTTKSIQNSAKSKKTSNKGCDKNKKSSSSLHHETSYLNHSINFNATPIDISKYKQTNINRYLQKKKLNQKDNDDTRIEENTDHFLQAEVEVSTNQSSWSQELSLPVTRCQYKELSEKQSNAEDMLSPALTTNDEIYQKSDEPVNTPSSSFWSGMSFLVESQPVINITKQISLTEGSDVKATLIDNKFTLDNQLFSESAEDDKSQPVTRISLDRLKPESKPPTVWKDVECVGDNLSELEPIMVSVDKQNPDENVSCLDRTNCIKEMKIKHSEAVQECTILMELHEESCNTILDPDVCFSPKKDDCFLENSCFNTNLEPFTELTFQNGEDKQAFDDESICVCSRSGPNKKIKLDNLPKQIPDFDESIKEVKSDPLHKHISALLREQSMNTNLDPFTEYSCNNHQENQVLCTKYYLLTKPDLVSRKDIPNILHEQSMNTNLDPYTEKIDHGRLRSIDIENCQRKHNFENFDSVATSRSKNRDTRELFTQKTSKVDIYTDEHMKNMHCKSKTLLPSSCSILKERMVCDKNLSNSKDGLLRNVIGNQKPVCKGKENHATDGERDSYDAFWDG